MDPGFSSFDAAVDVEMFLSEYGDDDTAERKRALMPQKCQLFSGRLEDGQMATAAETCGDGTCSLHSPRGSVMWTPAGNTYFCENARRKLCEAMPAEVSEIWTSPCGNAVRVLLDNVWSDVVGYCMRQTRQEPLLPGDSIGVEVFWQHLPLEQKAMIEEFVPLKIVELNEQATFTSDLARACAQLFHPSEKDLVGSLCVQLGYIRAEDSDALAVLRTDVNDDPLELFRPSKNDPQRSRYDTLFAENDDESSSLRQLFFATDCTMPVEVRAR